jgi:hypothetical protein
MSTVREARDRYLAANGFRLEDYESTTFTVKMLGIPLKLPSTKGRRAAVPLHDLHHVATGYATTWTGEAEIGAWELGAGCTTAVTYFLNGSVALIGLVIAPRRTLRAFRRGRGQTTLYRRPASADVLSWTVEELRTHLGISNAT